MSHPRNPYKYANQGGTGQWNVEQQVLLYPQVAASLNGNTDQGYYQNDTLPLKYMPQDGRRGNNRRAPVHDLPSSTEKETLLDTRPVQLAPSWEARNDPSDEVILKNRGRTDEFQGKPPTDRLNLVFLILMIHGIGTLMPWNMFITANSYFVDFKLKLNDSGEDTEQYRANFLSYLGIASQVPNVLCSFFNLFIQSGSGNSLTGRIVGSILVEVLIFIATIILAMIDSSTWPGTFFYVTMATVVVLNMAGGVYQNSVYGVAAKLPMKYSNAVVLGSNISGTLASIINIVSIAASPNLRTAAIYYFIAALFILLVCFDTYFALPLLRFYRYQKRLSQKGQTSRASELHRPPYWLIFKKVWPQCFNVFFIFFVTLAIFPAVQANIQPVDSNFIIPLTYFAPVTCFLFFNMFAMIGNIFPNWIQKPGPRFLWIPVVLRFLMIPYFMLCNYKPDVRVLPVLINNDWAYIAMAILLGLTSGYFSSLAMMYAPRCVEPEQASTAGMMAALFLLLGIFAGVNFSLFISWLVENRLY